MIQVRHDICRLLTGWQRRSGNTLVRVCLSSIHRRSKPFADITNELSYFLTIGPKHIKLNCGLYYFAAQVYGILIPEFDIFWWQVPLLPSCLRGVARAAYCGRLQKKNVFFKPRLTLEHVRAVTETLPLGPCLENTLQCSYCTCLNWTLCKTLRVCTV